MLGVEDVEHDVVGKYETLGCDFIIIIGKCHIYMSG